MNLKPSSSLVRRMLNSHSVLALSMSALLYIVCVTGTFSVFYPFYERWEQPQVAEYHQFDAAVLNNAAQDVMAQAKAKVAHLYIGLPSDDIPRVSVHADELGFFINADGSLGEKASHEWTHFIVELHYALTLPTLFGMSVVGIIGVMMLALIVSGLLAHPNIFKDAFRFRMNGTGRIKHVDLHNRLSVWTAPFQFFIALTGAMIGLSQIFVFAFANTFFDGDVERASASLFNPEPQVTNVAAPLLDVASIYRTFQEQHADLKPLGITVHEPGTTGQTMEVAALVPGRLVWAEFFQYNAKGELSARAGWSDGPVGTQIYASTYRLHFGHFAGLPLKLAYIALGMVMCIVVASGVKIWLLRRRQKNQAAPRLERLWLATIWGVPLAIAVSALAYITFYINAVAVFWLTLLVILIASYFAKNNRQLSLYLRFILTAVCVLVVTVHGLRFGSAAVSPAAILVNAMWLSIALGIVAWHIFMERRSGKEALTTPRESSNTQAHFAEQS